jgi:predicted lipoprotein with Yx(FWY)xxD motif
MLNHGGLSLKRRSVFWYPSRSTLGHVPSNGKWRLVRISGSGLLVATAVIHLDLYLTGYRTIPTIGWLFLLQIISGFALSAAVIASDSRLVSTAGAGFLMATLVGFLLSLRIGLFGFREVRTTAGLAAALIEIVGFVALAAFALRPYGQELPSESMAQERHPMIGLRGAMRVGRWLAGVLAVQAGLSLAVLWAITGTVSTNAGASNVILKFADVHGVSVLTNARGYTLYWFAPDSPSKSVCYGTCAAYWPPVVGKPAAAPNVVGKFGTFRRSGGALQITYNNHPLYTYVGDSSPGQANGNRINLNGGVWYEMRMSS